MLLAMMAVSLIAGRVTTASGRYKIFVVGGGALITAGLFLLSLMDTGTSRFTSGAYMAVLGAGMGFLMQTTMLIAQNSVEMKDMGVGSSSATLFRTIGGSFGVAIFGALFTHQVQSTMTERVGAAGGKAMSGGAQLDPKGLAQLPPQLKDAYLHAVADGTHLVFLWGAAISVVGFAAAWFLKEVPLRGGPSKPADAEPQDTAPADKGPVVHVG